VVKKIVPKDLSEIFNFSRTRLFELFAYTNFLRERHKKDQVRLCANVNVKSGGCPEDCSFCAQSARYKTPSPIYPMLSSEEIVVRLQKAWERGAKEAAIVTSGKGKLKKRELETLKEALKSIKKRSPISRCASLGLLDEDTLYELKKAGLQRYNHNLETSKRFFPKICTTHSYEEKIKTIKSAKKIGLKVCCGGIFGVGESPEDRIELALTLKELEVDSVPLNFLDPRPGTPLQSQNQLTPLECLKIIALFRLVLPEKDILVCGGREVNLRDLQCMIFMAGANGIVLGDYLTTKGRQPKDDLKMLEDLGLKPMSLNKF
jgi:biotin synthase